MDLRGAVLLLGCIYLVGAHTPKRNELYGEHQHQDLKTVSHRDIEHEEPNIVSEDLSGHSEETPSTRTKRQIGGPAQEAMDRSLTNNPVGQVEIGLPSIRNGYFEDRQNFGGRVGASAGVKVWESGQQSVGLGVGGHTNTGLHAGSPYINSPEVGAGVGYRNGAFNAAAGVNHGYQTPFQQRPTTSYGVGIGYRFKRSSDETETDLDTPTDETETKFDTPTDATTEIIDNTETRTKRQIGGPAQEAMARSLTTNPVGQVEIGRPTLHNPYFVDRQHLGGRIGGSAGVKVWESGQQSFGLGVAGQANAGLHGGRPYVNSPEVGAGVGYRRGAFSATAGVNHGYQSPFQHRPATSYGVGIGYRFRRSTDETESELDTPTDDTTLELISNTFGKRMKRQIGGPAQDAMARSLTTNPVGQVDIGRPTLHNPYFVDRQHFGGRVGGSAGVKVWESGQQNVGLGVAGQANAGLHGGRPYVNSPEVGAGVGYRHGAFSATAGVNHGYQSPFQHRPATSYGVGIGYRFRRSTDEIETELDTPTDDTFETRMKQQIGGPAQEAMARSLTTNPVGQVEIGHPTLHRQHFGDRIGGSAGVKVWESGPQSVGLGVAGQAHTGMHAGRPFVNSAEVGAGVGYRNGAFSATAGVNRGYQIPFQRRPASSYGVGIGYRF